MEYEKVAIISDLHANFAALDTFVSYINKEQIHLVLNLGDFISSGPNPCEVFDTIIEDKRFMSIRGYDEESLFNHIKAREGIGQGEWLIDKLGKERIKKLKEVPSIKKISINNKKFLLCHNNGWSDLSQLRAHTRELKNKSYDYIAFGGSHLQELSHSKGDFYHTKIIDPGTLGSEKNNKGYFAVITFEEMDAMINFHSIHIKKYHKVYSHVGKEENAMEITVEAENVQEDTFLYIQGQKTNNNLMYIDDEVVGKIIEIGIRQCKYVSIGCWSHEKHIIRELLYYLKCRSIKTSEEEGQAWYIGEITPEVVHMLLHKRRLEDGRLKWLEISFQNTLETPSPTYSIYHYGKEGFLKKLSMKELYSIEELLKKYNLIYDIPLDGSDKMGQKK